ncbi:uncharacterized protein LOC131019655 [Salvia miltiorrhiza]|uniref:uncharacterized protein LOC131019655 n=1 Tax=Salvia miltiorrhiza TaxID=226208 RepID=UPI0025ACBA29|nr:uncharacterized protein LOC131019655 [Salvia miltiorrhiza]
MAQTQQYLGAWTDAERSEVIKVLHDRTGNVDKDMSDPQEVRLMLDEIESCLATFTPTQFRRTRGEILGKIKDFIKTYNRFVSFISKPQIIYDVESNLVRVEGIYDYNRETTEETRFRLDGFQHYAAMKEVLEGSAIELVPWGFILEGKSTRNGFLFVFLIYRLRGLLFFPTVYIYH